MSPLLCFFIRREVYLRGQSLCAPLEIPCLPELCSTLSPHCPLAQGWNDCAWLRLTKTHPWDGDLGRSQLALRCTDAHIDQNWGSVRKTQGGNGWVSWHQWCLRSIQSLWWSGLGRFHSLPFHDWTFRHSRMPAVCEFALGLLFLWFSTRHLLPKGCFSELFLAFSNK